MPLREIALFRESCPGSGAHDTAVTRALLEAVAEGTLPESLRLYRPGDVVAFSPLDATRPGYADALAGARGQGFDACRRLAGGRAAVFHQETLAFAWCVPDPEPRARVRQRFEATAGLFVRALRRLGVDARVGAVAGEYCPGEHSVNAGGRTKLMGVGQRLVRGAAHVGGVLVVRDAERVRAGLGPVYRALGYEWDPAAAGSVEQELPAVTRADAAEVLLAELGRAAQLRPMALPEGVLERARGFEPRHRP